MGTDKNIKLHIVTDIKLVYTQHKTNRQKYEQLSFQITITEVGLVGCNTDKMGKLRFNQNARQESKLDPTHELKRNNELAESVDLGSSEFDYKSLHDTSNALVTEYSKKKPSKKKYSDCKVKGLSKKQKKKLECLHARKMKQKTRLDIFKSLQEHQLPAEHLLQYKSSSSIGQVDKKRKGGE